MTHVSIMLSGPTLSGIDDKVHVWMEQALAHLPAVTACLVELVQFPIDVGVNLHATYVRNGVLKETLATGLGSTVETALTQAMQDLTARLNARQADTLVMRRTLSQ